MSDLRSISECAKLLGIQRSRLSALITSGEIKKVKQGRESLVDYIQVCELVQKAAAKGKLKTPKKDVSRNTEENEFIAHLKEENIRLKTQLNALLDQVEGYEALKAEMKLLKAANVELQDKSKRRGVLSRIERAIDAFKE